MGEATGWRVLREAGSVPGRGREAAVIDPGIAGWRELAAGVPDEIELVLLDHDRDGLAQIAAWARTRRGYAALHLLGHGAPGLIRLGTLALDAETARARAGDLTLLGAALCADGDLLLYGCGTAAGAGRAFLDLLSDLTGAHVAGSAEPVGAAVLGGRWNLAVRTGPVQAEALAIPSFTGVLATLTLSSSDPDVVAANDINRTADTNVFTRSVTAGNQASFTLSTPTRFQSFTLSGKDYIVGQDEPASNAAGRNVSTLTISVGSGYSFDLAGFSFYDELFILINEQITITASYAAGGTYTGTGTFGSAKQNSDQTVADFSTLISGAPTFFDNITQVVISVQNASGTGSGYTFGTNNYIINDIRPLNAAPTLTGTSTQLAALEQTAIAVAPDIVPADDGTTLASATIRVTNHAAEDSLAFTPNGATFGDITTTGYVAATGTLTLTSASGANLTQWRDALRSVTYTDTADAPTGTARQISIVVNDGTGASSAFTREIAVANVNDAPTATNSTVSATEDTPYTFRASDFPFTDTLDSPANARGAVVITGLPALGTLAYNGTALSAADVAGGYAVTAASIGLLTYRAPADAAGTGYASFQFRVRDDGGTANGGQNLSTNTATLTIDVAAVNDAPVLDPAKAPTLGTQRTTVTGPPSGAAGTLVSQLVAAGSGIANVSDPDSGAQTGLALTATDTSQGAWWYSTDGGTSWTDVNAGSAVSAANALLLAADAGTRLYFGNTGGAGTLAAALGFRAWDRTAGTAGTKVDTRTNGGSSAFSAATDTASLTLQPPGPTVSPGRITLTGSTGTGGAFRIGDTVTARWDNSAAGDNNGGVSAVTMDFSAFGGGTAVTASAANGVWTATYAPAAGAIDLTNRNVSVTATDVNGPATASGTGNATVDTIAPTVTDARIAIGGATGTGGTYKIGDTVTATWNNTLGGDNNTDTITGVTVDFSQFGGGTAVQASEANGIWTATYTLVAGAVAAANRNVSVTATDNAGNATTTADSTNATVDSVAPASPVVTSAALSNSAAPTLAGTAEAGATLTLTVGGATYTTTAAVGGAWSVDLATAVPTSGALALATNGTNAVSVGARDAAGNVSAAPGTQTLTIDTTAPAAPGLALATDSGGSASDGISRDGSVGVTGLETGGSWAYSTDGGTTWTAGSAARFTLASGSYAAGRVQVRQTDAAGNTGAAGPLGAVTVDAAGPTLAAATVDGARLVLTFTDATALEAAGPPPASAFAVTAGGSAVAVDAVALDAAARTVALTLAAAVSSGQTVTVGYTDPNGDDATGVVQDLAGNDAAGFAGQAVANTTAAPPPPPPEPPVTTIDGVAVQTTTTANPDGSISTVVTVPVVTDARVESVGGNTVADIPLVTRGGGGVLAAQVPAGYGLTASGPGTVKTAATALPDLIREVRAHTEAGSSDQTNLTGGGSGFLDGLPTDAPLVVQTIVPNLAPGSGAPGTPLVITGQPAAPGTPIVALVIDTRGPSAGTRIALQNISFAAVVGSVSVTGGEGSQVVFGDRAAQSMMLGAAADTLRGGGGNDTLFGGADQDLVYGNQDADLIYGNQGADSLYGGQGDDRAYGGQGDDRIWGNTGADRLSGNTGQDIVYGNQGADVIYGNQGADTLFGGQDTDTLFGGQDADVVYGNLGADLVYGNQGADILYGGQGNDVLYGGQGDDTLVGGIGNDTLVGGLGADLYRFDPNSDRDLILGFNQAEGDRIALGGESYTLVTGQNGDAVLLLSGGGSVELAGIRPAQVGPDFFAAG